MARKGNQQKNALSRQSSNHNKGVSGAGFSSPNAKGRGKVSRTNSVAPSILSNGSQQSTSLTDTEIDADPVVYEKKSKQNSGKFTSSEKQSLDTTDCPDPEPCDGNAENCIRKMSPMKESVFEGERATSPDSNYSLNNAKSSFAHFWTRLHTVDMLKNVEFSNGLGLVLRRLETLVSSASKASSEWLERQKPWFVSLMTSATHACHHVRAKIKHAYPIVLRCLVYFGDVMLLLSMVWLDCAIRGIDSFLRMGTTSFFSVIWCSILSIVAMIGLFKFVLLLGIATLTAFLVGYTIAILLIAVCGIVSLWIYGSFWTTMLVIFCGGLAFMLKYERLALFVTTLYSVYCAWTYVGWLGLLLGLNLSFISSDALIFFLKNNIDEHRRPNRSPEQSAGMQDRQGFSGEPARAPSSEAGSGLPADRSSGIPSTSGSESEATSEDEVVRLLNCTDHYSALGLSRFENVDVSVLKREYRKKAMLVHPDKNMGNEKAAEAFKKLQNAYEVLLDSFKRKAYDDELRKEELLNYLRGFQNASQKNRGHGFFASGFAHREANSEEDLLGASRRIACRKCNNFHLWALTRKLKSRARWCQDCKDFHQAKDGDGWVEQSSRPFFFGILQKVDIPAAYVCADSKIYNATEWYICQGMRCPVNTHKPSFHVNTSVTSKHNTGKGASSGQRGGTMPASNIEETMTEEEFFEWLQNAVQAGMFDSFAASTSESPTAQTGHSSKSGGGANGNGGSGKKKKKGKKQW